MDDYLDQEIDRLNNRSTLALKLQRGVLPYTLLLFSFAVVINSKVPISLFWASYIIGMGFSGDPLPSGMRGYQESVFMAGLGFWIFGIKDFLFSLTIILFIQLVDDYIDYHVERYVNQSNFVNYLDKVGTFLLAMLCFGIAVAINWQLAIIIIIVTPVVSFFLG
ncbi:hypothetical protein [Halobacteroides halobius]|nr:hypothetical protein [Halobacteroides halobius]